LYTFDFEQAGVYNFFCEPHESVGMDGSITVLDKIESQNIESSSSDEEGGTIPFIPISGVLLLLILFYRVRISGINEL